MLEIIINVEVGSEKLGVDYVCPSVRVQHFACVTRVFQIKMTEQIAYMIYRHIFIFITKLAFQNTC